MSEAPAGQPSSDRERAADPATPPGALRALAGHPDRSVRVEVVGNPSSPPEAVLAALAEVGLDEVGDALEALLGNPSLPLWLLVDPTWMGQLPDDIALRLVRPDNLTPTLWRALCGHHHTEVKMTLLRSPLAPDDAWAQLGLDEALEQRAWLYQLDLPHLLELVRSPRLTTRGWAGLAGSWQFQRADSVRLKALLLASPAAPPDAWQRLGIAAQSLARQELRGADMAALVPHLPHDLGRLDVSMNQLGPAGAQALASWAGGSHLTSLDVSGNALTDAGAEALAAARCLGRLEQLEAWNNQLGPAGARALARSPHLGRVRELNLSTNRLGDAGASALAAGFAGLEALTLRGNQLGPAGAAALARAPFAPRLRRLDLSFNPLGDEGLGELARAPLGRLLELQLARASAGQPGLAALACSPLLGSLRALHLPGAEPGPGLEALRRAAADQPALRLHLS